MSETLKKSLTLYKFWCTNPKIMVVLAKSGDIMALPHKLRPRLGRAVFYTGVAIMSLKARDVCIAIQTSSKNEMPFLETALFATALANSDNGKKKQDTCRLPIRSTSENKTLRIIDTSSFRYEVSISIRYIDIDIRHTGMYMYR